MTDRQVHCLTFAVWSGPGAAAVLVRPRVSRSTPNMSAIPGGPVTNYIVLFASFLP